MSDTEREQALEEVARLAHEYSTSKEDAEEARDRLDKAMAHAKDVGASFRQLARASDRSVGFSQKALARTGYEPRADDK